MPAFNQTTKSRATAGRAGWLVLLVFCCSGATCSHSLRNPFVQLGPPAPEVLSAGASLEQVLAAVNQNASRIHSYQTNNASISIAGLSALSTLRGKIVAQRPGKLRLQAETALTGPEIDLGSNPELCWFWVKRNQPPVLYFMRHDQLASGAQRLPLEPQWLLDGLGLAKFAAGDQHTGPLPRGDGTIEIRSVIRTCTGAFTKHTVVDVRRAWVLEQHIYSAQGSLLASSRATSHRYYPESGVSLPQTLQFHLPAAQLALSIDVGNVQLNQVADNAALWQLPAIAPQIDLGGVGGVPGRRQTSLSGWGESHVPAPREISLPGATVPGHDPRHVASRAGWPATALPAAMPQAWPPTSTALTPSVAPAPMPSVQQLRPGGVAVEAR